jgi:hypothetical protein
LENEGDDESIADKINLFVDVIAKQISDIESSGIAAGEGSGANWICDGQSTPSSAFLDWRMLLETNTSSTLEKHTSCALFGFDD